MRLQLVINSNWHSIFYRFGDIAVYCSSRPPLWGLGTTYDVHLGLIGKRVVNCLLALIKLFHYVLRAETLRAEIDRNSTISLQYNTGAVERVHDFKLLGVYVDSTLSWTKHVEHIAKKATKRLYFLKVLKRAGLPPHHLLHYYLRCGHSTCLGVLLLYLASQHYQQTLFADWSYPKTSYKSHIWVYPRQVIC